MVKDVTVFIRAYATCQVKRTYNRANEIRLLTTIPITEPFAGVKMDLMGLLITLLEGHHYVILATVDYLTKWVEVRTLVSKDCENICSILLLMTLSCNIHDQWRS